MMMYKLVVACLVSLVQAKISHGNDEHCQGTGCVANGGNMKINGHDFPTGSWPSFPKFGWHQKFASHEAIRDRIRNRMAELKLPSNMHNYFQNDDGTSSVSVAVGNSVSCDGNGCVSNGGNMVTSEVNGDSVSFKNSVKCVGDQCEVERVECEGGKCYQSKDDGSMVMTTVSKGNTVSCVGGDEGCVANAGSIVKLGHIKDKFGK
eukprot:TRINITY_DN1334_c2_g1_i1.p1 TRINITY_DN1334_c2_g1~~TRINITY_DN1334_c2_g1_i1.p1  ORF type:complete len:205 (-),score=24.83 TRINITY_DN1334_c2_g1_i1:278-892(-)